MKKLCFVDFDMSVTGGVEQVTASLVNEFSGRYEVHLLSINGKGRECAYELDPSVIYHSCFEGDMRLRELMQRMFRPFCRYLKRHSIDIVMLMGNYPALVAGTARLAASARFVFCDHGALINQWEQKDITFIRRIDSLLAHRTVVLTDQTRRDYIKKFHMSSMKVACIYNWIADEVLENVSCRYEEESRKILTVGRFGPEKGYDMLVKVAEITLKKHPKWEWHLFGTGDTFEETKEEVNRAGLDQQVIMHGNVKDAYQYYHEYAFLVLPSYREGLPLVLMEAKANRLPVVSFDIMTGPREMVRDGVNGYLVEPYRLEEMAGRIEELIGSRKLRISMSLKAGLDMEKFSKEIIINQWEKLFSSL